MSSVCGHVLPFCEEDELFLLQRTSHTIQKHARWEVILRSKKSFSGDFSPDQRFNSFREFVKNRPISVNNFSAKMLIFPGHGEPTLLFNADLTLKVGHSKLAYPLQFPDFDALAAFFSNAETSSVAAQLVLKYERYRVVRFRKFHFNLEYDAQRQFFSDDLFNRFFEPPRVFGSRTNSTFLRLKLEMVNPDDSITSSLKKLFEL